MKLRAIALTCAAGLAVSTPAWASHSGWYLGLGVGVDQLMPMDITVTVPASTGRVSYDPGFIVLGGGGHKFDGGWRIEAEVGGDWHNAKALGGPIASLLTHLSGGTSTLTGFVNLAHDFKIGERWGLSLGGGLGLAEVHHYEDACLAFPSCEHFIS